MIKLLIGGSPCTYWSVAQKKGREVEAKGLGWELFKNYLIAKEKFKPDLFLYENNKSAAQPIKDQISRELGVDLMHINSALVSAQNRQRFYAFNWNVDQPADRGIMLKDILETTTSEKGYELRAPAVGVGCRNRREDDGKLYRRFETSGIPKANALTTVQPDSMVAEPIRIGTIENSAKKQSHDSKQYRVYSPEGKATTLCGEGGGLGAKTGLYAAPVRVGTMPNADGEITGGQAHRIYDASGKAVALCARPNGGGPETGLYMPTLPKKLREWRGVVEATDLRMKQETTGKPTRSQRQGTRADWWSLLPPAKKCQSMRSSTAKSRSRGRNTRSSCRTVFTSSESSPRSSVNASRPCLMATHQRSARHKGIEGSGTAGLPR